MGWLRKIGRKVGKVIKKIGRGIKKGLKGIVKGVGKLGILGTVAMMFVMPYIPILWTNLGTFASGLTASSNVFARVASYAMKGIYHAGRAAGRVYSTVSNAISGTLNSIPGVSTVTQGISRAFNGAMDWTRQKLGIGDPTKFYSEASLDYKEFQNVVGKDATLKDFEAWKKTDSYHEFKSINKQGAEIYDSMSNPNKFDRRDPTREGTYGKTDVLRKNESYDKFLERNDMESDRFLELNPDVPTVQNTLSDGTVIKTPELTPLGEYNVIPTEQEVIDQVRRVRLEGKTVDLEYDVDKSMYKIQSKVDEYSRRGLTPDEAYAELGRDYQRQFGDISLEGTPRYQSEFQGYARDPSAGTYYKQDADLLAEGKEGMDAVADWDVVKPKAEPNFFQKLISKDSIEDQAVSAAQSGIKNLMSGPEGPSTWNTYSYVDRRRPRGQEDLDMGFATSYFPTMNIGAVQQNAYDMYSLQENQGFGGGQPSYQAAGFGF